MQGRQKMGLRFSFDIGTNSIGFAAWSTGQDPNGIFGDKDAPQAILKSGVRIFSDGRNPKDGESLAVMRRVPKGARTRRDRFVARKKALIAKLGESGLFPADRQAQLLLQAVDPYDLRAAGLDRQLTLHEFGRILFHLNQRRGFQSNRKADRKTKNAESGKIALASKALAETLKEVGARSFGEWLWKRHNVKDEMGKPAPIPVRIRMDGKGATALYEFYPTRQMLKDEFDLLWESQAKYHPETLTESLRQTLRDAIIFYQRDLKPPKVGNCTFVEGEPRIPKCLASVEARELYERLNHLRLSTGPRTPDRPLAANERDALASALLFEPKLTMTKLRKALKLPGHVKINFEETGEKEIRGAATSARLAKESHFGRRWRMMDFAQRDEVISLLLEAVDADELAETLQEHYQLTEAAARECAGAPLADGYSRLGATANNAILDELINGTDERGYVIPYSEAVRRAGWHHSDERDGEILDALPYYGQVLQRHIIPGTMDKDDRGDQPKYWGRIANPTVHIGLGQLRRLVNLLIKEFGHPDQIVVELARELKQNKEQKERTIKENRQNRDANERRSARIAEVAAALGDHPETMDTGENRAKLKLYEEQAQANGGIALCPFSLRPMQLTELFSDKVEFEHLLPMSRSFDGSSANKVVCFRVMNRVKRGKTPFEAFGGEGNWPDIAANAARLPPNKRWRFEPDAWEKFEQGSLGKLDERTRSAMGIDSGFLARQLNETKYLSRIAKAYLGKICDPDQIYVTPGTLTGMLRGKWGLNGVLGNEAAKNRSDQRHHALDAIVIGAMTRAFLNAMARQAGQAEAQDFDRALGDVPKPFEHFRDAVKASLDKIVVSVKPEHGTGGALHEDTAYGFVRNSKEAAIIGNLVRRKAAADLTPSEADSVRDEHLRKLLQAEIAPLRDAKGKLTKGREKDYAAALQAFARAHNLRRLRIGKEDKSVVPINDRKTGLPYKAVVPGENHHMDIVQMRDGTWQGFAATVFEVNQRDYRPKWERAKLGGKLVMRLHKGDMVELEDKDGVRKIKRVVRLAPSNNRIYLADHKEGNPSDSRSADPDDAFEWDLAGIGKLKERQCAAVIVDEIGRVRPRRSNV